MGNYPRHLKLSVATQERLVSYLTDELFNHNAERQPAIQDLMQAQTDYWAKPVAERRTFPFTGAANIIIPLTAIAYETVHARSVTTHFAVSPFTSVKARRGDFQQFENPLEDYFQYELTHNIKHYRPIDDILAELEKFGTGVGKSGYEKIVRKAIRTSPDGLREEEFPVIVKDGATLDPVPLANFIMPHYAKDPQVAPWCGEIHSEPPYQLRLMEQAGLMIPGTYESLQSYFTTALSTQGQDNDRTYQRHQETLENRKAVWPKIIDWKEIWLAFDVDNDNKDEEIVVHYHEPSKTIMALFYNWYDDLHRPYRYGNYILVEGRWRGIGICKQNEQFQRSITTQHRQRLDNATIANMRMFKIHRLAGYGPKEPIFPGKFWFLDDMTHIDSIEMGDVRQSAFADEQSTLIYSQMRTKVNEVTLGMPQQGTPGTATGDLARIKESQSGFDYVMKNEKYLLNELLMDVFCNIHQFGPKNISYFQWAEGGELVQQLFAMPTAMIREGILFEVGAAGIQQNRVLDRQNWMQIAQVLQGYYASMLQLAQLAGDNNISAIIVKKGFTAATEAIRQILESFDIRNIDRMVLVELEQMLGPGGSNGGNGGPGAVPFQRGGQGSPGNGSPQGMDALAQIVKVLGGNGAPGSARV